MKTPEQQTMIIVWKWKHLPVHLNQLIIERDYHGQLPRLQQEEEDFFSEFKVEWSAAYPTGKLVAASIYQDGILSQQMLEQIIEIYLPDKSSQYKNKVMLFLHRGNGYKESHVNELLEKFGERLFKVFLFSDRKDYIYYDTQKAGLLDDTGRFAYGKDEASGAKFSVQDLKTKAIKQPYFDRVWHYYSNEFETKVFRLKEDLFKAWFPLLLPQSDSHLSKDQYLQIFQEVDNQLLWYRLRSFCGIYNEIDEKNPANFEVKADLHVEVEKIMSAERERGESLLFDDCIANLEQEKNRGQDFISKEYEDIRKDLRDLLFNEERNHAHQEELRSVADKFNYLVKIIPGVMD